MISSSAPADVLHTLVGFIDRKWYSNQFSSLFMFLHFPILSLNSSLMQMKLVMSKDFSYWRKVLL